MDFDIIIKEIVKDNTPKYVVPTSNFTDAHLIGVPCLVLKGPYQRVKKHIWGGSHIETVIDVKSCVSGLEYAIPTIWTEKYNSLVEANEHAQIIGHHFPDVRELIGKPYWPRDNSFITGLHWPIDNFSITGLYGETHIDLYRKKCEIVSVPFTDTITIGDGDCEKEYTFILVKHNGKYYRTLFEEWALVEP